MASPYATDKLAFHPAVLDRLGSGRHAAAPVVVHFMPELRCNQRCAFCAYGHHAPGDGPDDRRRNEELMDESKHLPLNVAVQLVDDLESMGTRAIELTGGGEPLVWPHIDWFLSRMASSPMDLALVTNGTALTADRAALFGATRWMWARVSIDAGTCEDYTAVRRVPASHWARAWEAVGRLADLRGPVPDTDRRVGVGHVVTEQTFRGVLALARLAKGCGADNVRLSLPFGTAGEVLLAGEALAEARRQAVEAKAELECETFRVHDLLAERAGNVQASHQDYRRCVTQEVLCVVGGDAKVYSCCTLAFTASGLLGDLREQPMRDLWPSLGERFACHDSRRDCALPCLYERRNMHALELLSDPGRVEQIRAGEPPLHENYL